MKTGLTKRQKTTCIYFDEASKTVEIQTHNTALKKRLAQYAAKHPDLCRQTDDDEHPVLLQLLCDAPAHPPEIGERPV